MLLISNASFGDQIKAIKSELTAIAEDRHLLVDSSDTPGYQDYRAWKAAVSGQQPQGIVSYPDDP